MAVEIIGLPPSGPGGDLALACMTTATGRGGRPAATTSHPAAAATEPSSGPAPPTRSWLGQPRPSRYQKLSDNNGR